MDKPLFPLILLAAVWGLLTPALKIVEMTNDRRDKILDRDAKLDVGHKRLMLYSDWLTLFAAMYVYIITIAVMIFNYPNLAGLSGVDAERAGLVCRAASFTIVATAAVGLLSGYFDFAYMRRRLREESEKEKAAASPAAPPGTPG